MNVKEFLQNLKEKKDTNIKYVVVVNGERICRVDNEEEAWDIALGYQNDDSGYYGLYPDVNVITDYDGELEESQSQEIGQEYRRLSNKYGIDFNELVYGKDGFMKSMYPDNPNYVYFPDFNGDVIFSEKHWNELVDWAEKNKGIKLDKWVNGDTFDDLLKESRHHINPFDWKEPDEPYIEMSTSDFNQALTYEGEDEPDIAWLTQEHNIDIDKHDHETYIFGDYEDLQNFIDYYMLGDYGVKITLPKNENLKESKLNEAPTKTKSIANKIVKFLKNSKYLRFIELEEHYDGRISIRYDFNKDLINQARNSMKKVLDDTRIDIEIVDYDGDLEVSITSMYNLFTDDWCESFDYDGDDEELYEYLEENLGNEALLDNAQNNDTWEESLEDDDYYHFDFLGDISKEEVKDLITTGEETYATNEKDKKVWDSLTDEEKCLLVLDDDMGFHFDNTLDNEEIYAKVSELQSRFNKSIKEYLEVQNQHNKHKDVRKISKQDLIKATIDELNEPQDDLDFFVKQKLIKSVDDFKKANKKELAKKMVNDKAPYVVMLDKDNDFAVDLSTVKHLDENKNISQSSKYLNKSKKIKEDKQVTYVWKKDGDDHILTERGKNKALITLSRMNNNFPWTIYKGNKKITLDNDSDKLSDIKSYILNNVDKILGKKLKESNDDFVVDPLDDYLSDLEKLFKDKQIVNYSKLLDYVEQADIYDEDEIFLTTKEIDKTTELTILNILKQYFSEKNIPIAISVEDYNDGKRFIILVNANNYDKNFLKDFEYKGNWYNAKKDENLKESKKYEKEVYQLADLILDDLDNTMSDVVSPYDFEEMFSNALINMSYWDVNDLESMEKLEKGISTINGVDYEDNYLLNAVIQILALNGWYYIRSGKNKGGMTTKANLINGKTNENLKEDKTVDDWLKPMLLCDTLEREDFISFAYEDQDGSTVVTTSWETTPRKAHSDYIKTREMKVVKDNYSIEVLRQESRDNNKEFAYVMRITPKKVNENLKEAKGKLDDALPEIKEYINEYKDKIIEYGEALKQGNVKNPNYKNYTTRFVFDIFYFLKNRGFNIYKYVDENDLQDKYIETLMKKALSDCGIKITLEEDLDTFNDKMDFLAKDEDEAIDGYKKVIKTIDNKNVKTQLGKIEKEEKAHKDYLEKVKKNKNIKYTEPLMDEE